MEVPPPASAGTPPYRIAFGPPPDDVKPMAAAAQFLSLEHSREQPSVTYTSAAEAADRTPAMNPLHRSLLASERRVVPRPSRNRAGRMFVQLALILVSAPTQPARATDDADALLTRLVGRSPISSGDKRAALGLIRSGPDSDGWGCTLSDGTHFGAARVRIPRSDGDGESPLSPPFLHIVEKEARFRMLAAAALHEATTQLRDLPDAHLRTRAVLRTIRTEALPARFRIVSSGATYTRDVAVAYAIGEPAAGARGAWLTSSFIRSVRASYAFLLVERAGALVKRKAWKDALLLFREAAVFSPLTPDAMLDTAECFLELGSPRDALLLLADAADHAGTGHDASWWERCGDLAIRVGPPGEDLAIRAFDESARVLNR